MITCWQTGNISSTAGWIFLCFGDFNFAGSLKLMLAGIFIE